VPGSGNVDWDFSPFQNSCARILKADRHPSIEVAHRLSPDAITEQGVKALLCRNLDALIPNAEEPETANSPDEALVSWFREWVAFAHGFRGCHPEGGRSDEPGLRSL